MSHSDGDGGRERDDEPGAMRASGDIVPHHLLARAGWPAETDPDLLWLKPHLARLRAKVEGAGGPQILAVRGVGYRIEAGT